MIFSFHLKAQESQKKSWYTSVEKVEDIQIFINFPKDSVNINPVYNFHLRSLSLFLKKNKQLYINIYKNESNISNDRANEIKNFLINTIKAPADKIDVLPEEYNEENKVIFKSDGSEDIRVLLTKSEDVESQKSEFKEIVELEETVQEKKINKTNRLIETGLSNRFSRFNDGFDNFALGPMFKLSFNTEKTLRPFLESTALFYLNSEATPEVSFSVGLDYVYNVVKSSTKMYYMRNTIQSTLNDQFQAYDDIGIGQDISLKLLHTKRFKYEVGAFALFSFSNNTESFQNSNILIYGLQNTVKTPYKVNFKIRFSKRRIQEIDNFSEYNEHIDFVVSYEI